MRPQKKDEGGDDQLVFLGGLKINQVSVNIVHIVNNLLLFNSRWTHQYQYKNRRCSVFICTLLS